VSLRSLRIGRLAGIPIGLQPLWLLIVALITWGLGEAYYPDEVPGIAPAGAYALGLVSALLLFASILLHELGHAIVARRHGVEIEEIDLWLLGGVAKMKGLPHEARDELRFALAGPAVTLAIALAFGLLAVALPASTPAGLEALIAYQAFVNTAILIFNLLPAFPLDGGRVARALIWSRTGDMERATSLAATIGRGFGYAMIALGLLAAIAGGAGGLWLVIVGFFVVLAGRGEEAGVRVRTAFAGREAGRFMSYPAVTIPAATEVDEAVERYFVQYRFSAFPVTEDGTLIGMVDMEAITAVPAQRRARTRVGEIATNDPDLFIGEDQDVAELLERPGFQRAGRAVVLTGRGAFGILSITDVQRALRAQDLRSGAGGARADHHQPSLRHQ
jgi:Zn-dependent protease